MKKEVKFKNLEGVSGGTYHRYEVENGRVLWAVYDEATGDWDPGYESMEAAMNRDWELNGNNSHRGQDLHPIL